MNLMVKLDSAKANLNEISQMRSELYMENNKVTGLYTHQSIKFSYIL